MHYSFGTSVKLYETKPSVAKYVHSKKVKGRSYSIDLQRWTVNQVVPIGGFIVQ